jgi:pilus assembly protein CpaC
MKKILTYPFALRAAGVLTLLAAGAGAARADGMPPCVPSAAAPCPPEAAPRRVAPAVPRAVAAPPAETVYLPQQDVNIVLGEIQLLPVPGKIGRVALGNGAVVSATTVDGNVLLIAEQAGDTGLMVWSGRTVHRFRVHVSAQDMGRVREKVDAIIAGNKGVQLRQVGPDLVLSGFAHKEALERMTPMLQGLPNVINNIGEDQGSAFTRSVLFRLHFVEVKRSVMEKVGIDWAKSMAGPTLGVTKVFKKTGIYNPIPAATDATNLLDDAPQFVTRSGATGGLFLGLASTLTSRINLGVSDGDARVLASPELTARSGGKAKLQVGGEVPIPLAGAFGATTVEFKPYGILFAIEPQIDADNTITAKVSTELSQIDPSVQVGGIPGFITRNTATEVSVKPGEVVALSGLVNSELANAVDRVPGLSKIPIFGRLFRSDDFRNQRSELVVFVETEIISAGDGLASQLRARGLGAKQEFEQKAGAARQPEPTLDSVPAVPFIPAEPAAARQPGE